MKDGERGAAVREQNYPQFTTVDVSCAEVCVFTNILVIDLNLNYMSKLEILFAFLCKKRRRRRRRMGVRFCLSFLGFGRNMVAPVKGKT